MIISIINLVDGALIMKDERKTQKRLISELEELRKKTDLLEKGQAKYTQSDERFRESEERYKLLAENTQDIIWTVDTDHKFTFVSPSVKKLLGYTPEEAIGRKSYEYLAPKDRDKAKNLISKAFEKLKDNGGEPFELHNKEWNQTRKDGSKVWTEIGGKFLFDNENRLLGVIGITRDISKRKLAQQELEESEERFRRLSEASLEGVAITDKGKVMDANDTFLEMFGYSSDEITGMSPMGFVTDEFKELVSKNVKEGHEEPYETLGLRKDGTTFNLEVCGKAIPYRGRTLRVTTLRDITARKLAEEALRESEEKWRALSEYSPSHIMLLDKDGRVLFINRTVPDLSKDEVIGKTVYDFVPQEFHKVASDCFQYVLTTGKPSSYITEYMNSDGETRYFDVRVGPVSRSGRIVGLVSSSTDITESKRMEEELLKAQKLESVGLLAGGIAHDFNNILTSLLGHISLVKMASELGSKQEEMLSAAEIACKRATDLTKQLLTFAMGGEPVKKTASLSDLIYESVKFVLRGSNVYCDFSIPDDIWQIEVDKGQMNQVFNNLVINANQAMPQGGKIQVSAENITHNSETLSNGLPIGSGKYVMISIKDEGIGIDREHHAKIFDPYFTTKQSGSGLGLTTCYSIVKKHCGHIGVESAPGEGATFNIYLPASENQLSPEKGEEKIIFGNGKILVMDDENEVKIIAGEMLQYLGYKVELASNGDEAIAMYKEAEQSGEPIKAMVLDLTVPGEMGGKECINKLLKIDPQIKAIVSSGYSNDPVMANYEEYGFSGVLSKPYKMEELSREISKLTK